MNIIARVALTSITITSIIMSTNIIIMSTP